ncbi:hypothetical protein BU23DRAFT_601770 [Bimuria novae-zelandiae CBS 107.79]|uniref:Uncharacterized protein n=1 Tax=Bimuria novae-zelandiae CBS 107.79 TaxID=1447943 RepID=A0A6A5UWI6_9PLEO|nr:hypothetical protein BU23DRAFT_601770 [Bimuria novae-zelandiae CBS 107.79]
MSRISTPFSDTGEDAFLPSIEEDSGQYSAYGDFLEDDNTPTISSTFDEDVLDHLNFELAEGTIAPSNSRTARGTSTPNYEDDVASREIGFGGYCLGQRQQAAHAYPSLNESLDRGSHPYHIQHHASHGVYQRASERPLPYRANTNAEMGYAAGLLQNFKQVYHPTHRRSWSQNDTEHIINLPPDHYLPGDPHHQSDLRGQPHANANPTFFRLCETRHTRSHPKTSSEYKKQAHAQGRTGNRGRPNAPTSMPVSIGTPIQPDDRFVPTAGNIQLTGPRMVHMSHVEQLRTSRRIIEVGAMAVVNKALVKKNGEAIDPLLLDDDTRMRQKSNAPSPEVVVGGSEPRERMLKDLDHMKLLLKDATGKEADEALKGCEMIREALAKMEDRGGGGGAEDDSLDEKPRFADDSAHASGPAPSDGASPLSDGDDEFLRRLMESSPSFS